MSDLEPVVVTGGVPVFESADWNEHVETYKALDTRIQADKWRQAAVCASLTGNWGERGEVLARFASEVFASARTIYDYAATWKAFANRERSEILSFTHHSIAARAEDPEAAIERAEIEELSTRELAQIVHAEREVENVEIARSMRVCPTCNGAGEIPDEDSSLARPLRKDCV